MSGAALRSERITYTKGSGIAPSTTASWMPTTITLTRVPL